MSIRATVRITGAAKNTVTKLLVDLGRACEDYQDKAFRDLPCKHIQCDEIWSFCYPKQKNVPDDFQGVFGYGDVWTSTAICADTKLVPSWLVVNRSAESAHIFMNDIKRRLKHRAQLTTDGHRAYLEAVEYAFGGDIDYPVLIKLYGNEGANVQTERLYSPAEVTGTRRCELPASLITTMFQRALSSARILLCG